MAEEASQDNLEKTEEPTPKRREDARTKGQFAKSRYLIPVMTLAAIFVGLRFGGEALIVSLQKCIVGFFGAAGSSKPLAIDDVFDLTTQAGLVLAPILLPFLGGVVVAALAGGFLQSGFVMAAEPLHVDFSRIDPFAGFRRLFSIETAMEVLKSVIVIGALVIFGGLFMYADLPSLSSLSALASEDIIAYASRE